MPLFWGGAIHACHKPHVAPWEVPTPLDTKDTQSQQGAKILYNRTWFCTCGPNFNVVWIPLSHSCPDIWVREPDWLHFPYSGERPFCGYSWLYCFASSRVFCFLFLFLPMISQVHVCSLCLQPFHLLFLGSFSWRLAHAGLVLKDSVAAISWDALYPGQGVHEDLVLTSWWQGH